MSAKKSDSSPTKQAIKKVPATVHQAEANGLAVIELVNEVKMVGEFTAPIPLFFIDIESTAPVASTAIASIGVVAVNAAASGAEKYMVDCVVSSLSREFQRSLNSEALVENDLSAAFNCRTLLLRPSLSEQILRHGRKVTHGTQQWWTGQPAAQRSLFSMPEQPVDEAFYTLIRFLAECCHGFVHAALRSSDADTDQALVRKLTAQAFANVRVVVRGSQFDVAALESLAYDAIGALPAVVPDQAFNGSSRYANPTLWHFRHVSCSRSVMEGYRLGVMAALRDSAEAKKHVQAISHTASDRVRSVVAASVDLSLEFWGVTDPTVLHQMTADIGTGGHTPIVDCLYDAFQVLAIVSGTSGEVLASQLGGECGSD